MSETIWNCPGCGRPLSDDCPELCDRCSGRAKPPARRACQAPDPTPADQPVEGETDRALYVASAREHREVMGEPAARCPLDGAMSPAVCDVMRGAEAAEEYLRQLGQAGEVIRRRTVERDTAIDRAGTAAVGRNAAIVGRVEARQAQARAEAERDTVIVRAETAEQQRDVFERCNAMQLESVEEYRRERDTAIAEAERLICGCKEAIAAARRQERERCARIVIEECDIAAQRGAGPRLAAVIAVDRMEADHD